MFDFDVRSGGAGGDNADTEVLPRLQRPRAGGDEFSATVSSIPRRPPLVVTPSAPLMKTLEAMAARHTGAALVASHGVLLGVLTERDIVRRLSQIALSAGEVPVWKVMAAEPETLLETDTVAYAIRKVAELGGRSMPVLRAGGTLVGVLEPQDIVAWWCARTGENQSVARGPLE